MESWVTIFHRLGGDGITGEKEMLGWKSPNEYDDDENNDDNDSTYNSKNISSVV